MQPPDRKSLNMCIFWIPKSVRQLSPLPARAPMVSLCPSVCLSVYPSLQWLAEESDSRSRLVYHMDPGAKCPPWTESPSLSAKWTPPIKERNRRFVKCTQFSMIKIKTLFSIRKNFRGHGYNYSVAFSFEDVLGPKLFFVIGLVIFVTAVARLVCLDLVE